MQITNELGIPLSLAVWLLHDEYDYNDAEKYISVTGLMRPIRQIVLPPRIPKQELKMDLADMIPRALGHSLHHSIERAWTYGYRESLRLLNYPDNVIDRVRINPTQEELVANPDIIPIYLEQRQIREFDGYKVGGKFDMVTEGIVNDTKSTTAYTWLYGTRDEENILQGSLYRWIDAAQPHPKITEDYMQINYIFTDWQKFQAKSNPKYPQKRLEKKTLQLMSVRDTDDWVRAKLTEFQKYRNTPEVELPWCTDEELWRSEPSYKYYSDPTKTSGKSTKNFTDLVEANSHLAEKGKGVVITKPGEVKRCGYCNAFDACTQKDNYI